jgi:hypothetical protein
MYLDVLLLGGEDLAPARLLHWEEHLPGQDPEPVINDSAAQYTVQRNASSKILGVHYT